MNIRKATLDDLPELLEIYNHAIINLTSTFDLEPHTIEQRREWFEQFDDRYPLTVVELDGEVAGYCSLSPYNKKAAYAKTSEVSIYIAEDHRGKKLGSILMKTAIDKAQELGFHAIIAGITAGNDVSIKLHKKFGFIKVGHLKEVGYKFGEWQDVLYYQLLL